MMKTVFLCLLSIFILMPLHSKDKSEKIPKKITKSIPLLTEYLTKNIDSKKEKVFAVYKWITTNIAYDYDQLQSNKYFTGVNPKDVLRKKKAICNGYVEVMKAMLDELDIKCETIEGYIHNEYWSPGMPVLTHSHAWISFNVDGDWYLADPTWDAGYIGRLPIDKKPYKPKWYLQKKFKNSERSERVNNRRNLREETRKEAHEDKPEFKDKIGFVRKPDTNYIWIENDSFLLRHLPVNPIWQLREDYISIEDFALATDSLKLRLDQTSDAEFEYEDEIGDYMTQDYLHKLIATAESGYEYNPYNPGIKALNYYNFVALVQNKKLQKLARGSVYELTPEKYPSLMQKNDTIIKYNKQLKTFIGENYKRVKKFDKENNKAAFNSDKDISKAMRTIAIENSKMVKFAETSFKKIESYMKYLSKQIDIIENKYPTIKGVNYLDNVSAINSNGWVDSLRSNLNLLLDIDTLLSSMYVNNKFNSILTDVNYITYLLKLNGNIIRYNTHSNNSNIAEIDSMIKTESKHVIMLYEDSVRFEIYNSDVMSIVKQARATSKIAIQAIKKTGDTDAIIEVQKEMDRIFELAQKINLNCLDFDDEVLYVMKNYKKIKNLTPLAEKQKKYKKHKNDFIVKESKTSSEREASLVKKIDSDSKFWRRAFKAKIRELG